MDTDNNLPSFFVLAGASAGGTRHLPQLVEGLERGVDAAFFMVTHIPEIQAVQGLVMRIQEQTTLVCKIAQDGELIKKGHVYVAVPNRHLLLAGNKIKLGRGPVENRWRPSIDALFRSAAVAFNSRVIGIILSGYLQDGTAGMLAIKDCGGTCVVQSPQEAENTSMIDSVMQHVAVDHILPVQEMLPFIGQITRGARPEPANVPAAIKAEAAIAENEIVDMDILKKIANHTLFTCPDCGGGLWEIDDGFKRYRCHTGHQYTEAELQRQQSKGLESTLWVALRMLEERKQLLVKAGASPGLNNEKLADQKLSKVHELSVHIQRLKELLFDIQPDSVS